MALVEPDRFATAALLLDDKPAVAADDPEPVLAAAPFFIEFDEPARLDPERIGLTWELPPASRPAMRWRSPLTSLAAHLLPLLLIVGWASRQPTSPRRSRSSWYSSSRHRRRPRRIRRRSRNIHRGRSPRKIWATPSRRTPAPRRRKHPRARRDANRRGDPAPIPPPKPQPPKETSPISLPKPAGIQAPPRETTPQLAPRAAHYAGPSASRDDYLAYLVTLTRQHLNLLPRALVGSRSGETVISVVVMANGAIGPVSVARSSRYPDIDQRIAEMVKAVGKFPPLPQWYQGSSVQLELTMRFPEALER